MHILKRRLYRRGSSYEVTVPMPILFGMDLKTRHTLTFSKKQNRWSISFDKKPNIKSITRSLYKRGSSYETTIPLQLLLELNPNRSYYVLFKFDKEWHISFEEVKDE